MTTVKTVKALCQSISSGPKNCKPGCLTIFLSDYFKIKNGQANFIGPLVLSTFSSVYHLEIVSMYKGDRK